MAKISDLFVNIGAKTTDLDKGLKKANSNVSTFSKGLGKIAGIAATAFSARAVIGFASEASRLAGILEGVEAAFDNLNQPGLLDELRRATKNTTTDLALMQAAINARNFKIPLDQMGSLLEFARRRAKDTGQEVEFLVNSIIIGIGRKSPLILDNLGISAIELRKQLKGVGTEAATVGDVTEAVGRIATQAMREAGEETGTFKDKTDQLKTSLENIKTEIGGNLNRVIENNAVAINKPINKVKELNKSWSDQITIYEKVQASLVTTGKDLSTFEKLGIQLNTLLGHQDEVIMGLVSEYDKLHESIEKTEDASSELGKTLEPITPILKRIKDEIKEYKKAQDEATTTDEVIKYTFKIKELQNELNALTKIKLTNVKLPDIDDVSTADIESTGFAKDDIGENVIVLGFEDQIGSQITEIAEEADTAWNTFFENQNANLISFNEAQTKGAEAQAQLQELVGASFVQTALSAESAEEAFIASIRKIISSLVAQGIAGAISNTLTSTGPAGLILAPLAGAAAGALFNSFIPKFAGGGIVPGASMSGDNVLAGVNSGELILNQAQQGNIAGQLTQGRNININIAGETRLEGTQLITLIKRTEQTYEGVY